MKVYKEIDSSYFPVFAKKEFLKSRSDEFGWLGLDNWFIPYIIDQKFIFRRLIFTNDIFSLDVTTPLNTKEFLNLAMDTIKNKLNVDFVSKAQGNVVFQETPNASISAEWGTYIKMIPVDRDSLMTSFNSKTRNMIRRGLKEGLEVEPGSVLELYTILKETFARQKDSLLCPSFKYLKDLKRNLNDNFLILKCSKNNQIQSVVGIPFDFNRGYYLYGGSISRPLPGSMNLLQYEVMLALGKKGVKTYDFVGARINADQESKYYGIQKFKMSFNPELSAGYCFKVIFNKPKYFMFQILIKIAYLFKGGKYKGDPIDQIRKQNKKKC